MPLNREPKTGNREPGTENRDVNREPGTVNPEPDILPVMIPPPHSLEDKMTSSYVKVLVVQLLVLAALWWLQQAFI
jgi:hypothetical protein